MYSSSYFPTLNISVDAARIAEEWAPEETSEDTWINLEAKDETFRITSLAIAQFLECSLKLIEQSLASSIGSRRIEILLYHKFNEPYWRKLDTILKRKFPYPERKTLYHAAMKTINLLCNNPEILLALPEEPTHFTRKQMSMHLPLEVGNDGSLFIILKSETHSNPFASGESKRLYYALELETFSLAAWAKISIATEYRKSLLEDEINLQSQLTSKGVVKIFHHTKYTTNSGEKAGLMMEYCHTDMHELMNRYKLTRKIKNKLWNVFQDILEALAEMEEKKIHHRDLKPENIFIKFVNNKWRGKIGDFGLAIQKEKEKLEQDLIGTYLYFSPDYCNGIQIAKNCLHPTRNQYLFFQWLWPERNNKHEVDQRSLKRGIDLYTSTKNDIWSIGLTLFELRSNQDVYAIISQGIDQDSTEEDLIHAITNITQENVDSNFSEFVQPNSLEALNLMMLTVDQQIRPSAKKCYKKFLDLRRNGAAFK